mmetsp:Transcript_38575/g.111264  ORF Transcript_38575/g.111264 Transcript_38575/m.111264 type:complete len:128 (+) Transcript_38575:2-385(+)
MGAGLACQGLWTLMGPKSVIPLEVVCFMFLGSGMGAVDGTSPAILGDIADRKFGGTGRIYLMSNVAVQAGFVVGPVLGNAVVEVGGFPGGMLVMGGALLIYSAVFAATTAARRAAKTPASAPLLAAA